ncbi:hypothetical protein [Psychroflexus aestuariivivens]|uniref:hypothetical protein n=1 Tax=Psychroflexus aestuariivivens TaxID=1795040 RepID=UPI000FDC6B25|nr:hypothetical protein [Psychroflexus aestuariivivens]
MKEKFLFFILIPIFNFAQDKPIVDVGGALRYNYLMSSWNSEQKDIGGDFVYDFFRINAEAKYKNVYLNAEYREYSSAFGGGFMKQGWLGYSINEQEDVHLGLTQVPFGIQTYNSHNWFFNLTYYVGLEDDHDLGVKYMNIGNKFEYQLAFFKNSELLDLGGSNEVSTNRYAYDIVGTNKEINQVNGKFVYKTGEKFNHRLGLSAQYGGLYNIETKQTGNHHALALHHEIFYKRWNLKTELISARHNPKNPEGERRDVVRMGAYGFPYDIASDFEMYTAAISYGLPVEIGPISKLTFYNDFGYMDKKATGFKNSAMNVTGVLVTAGDVYIYIDYAAGYNHSWFGGDFTNELGEGNPNLDWEARFNINFGYYFLTDNKSR